MSRYFFAVPISVVVAMLLFSFMAWMVDNGRSQKPEYDTALQFNMIMVEKETAVQKRHRTVPKQPKLPPSPPTSKLSKPISSPSIAPSLNRPVSQLSMNTAIKGVAVQAINLGTLSENRQLMPIYRVEPNYPPRALRRNIEGYVVIQFDIDKKGRPFNIQIIESKPNHIFDREALRAVHRWKYQPNMENGNTSVVTGQQTKVEFRIAK